MSDRDSFDLFDGLSRLGKRDVGWYSSLTPEGKKAASPFVMMRWLTGTSDEAQIVRINTFVNPAVFSLGNNKELLFSLLAVSCTGKNTRYSWLKAPTSKTQKLRTQVIKQYYDLTTREARHYDVDAESVINMALELGWEDDELKKLKAEISKDGSGGTEGSSQKSKVTGRKAS